MVSFIPQSQVTADAAFPRSAIVTFTGTAVFEFPGAAVVTLAVAIVLVQ